MSDRAEASYAGASAVPRRVPDSRERLVRETVEEGRTLLGPDRLGVLWDAIEQVAGLGLPVCEVGVYRGGSARFIAGALAVLARTPVTLHAIDTFEGHPAEKVSSLDPFHEAGRFGTASYDEVRTYLSRHPGVVVHRGELSQILPGIAARLFGFAHLDVDLHRSTADALAILGARIAKGGVMVVDDYRAKKCPGVELAVREYLATIPGWELREPATEQAVLVRL